jgi:hypothetical protein
MDRRALLAALAGAGTTGLAGCGGVASEALDGGGAEAPTTPTATPTATPAGPPVREQTVRVANERPGSVYLTVVVVDPRVPEADAADADAAALDGRTVFVESVDLPAGREATFPDVLARGGDYVVVVETADGDRYRGDWAVTDDFDGLRVRLDEGATFRRQVRCGPDCPAALDGRGGPLGDLPLIGDGSGQWFTPATLVLRNPTAADREVGVGVSLRDDSLFDYRYRVAAESRLTVPVTYRSGEYDLRVDPAGGEGVQNTWSVPAEMERHVVLGESLELGCGPARTVLRFRNRDRDRRALAVTVTRDGEQVYRGTVTLDPDERRELTPVERSGRYRVRVRSDGGGVSEATWWACPPHGPAEVLVDASGHVFFRQELSG